MQWADICYWPNPQKKHPSFLMDLQNICPRHEFQNSFPDMVLHVSMHCMHQEVVSIQHCLYLYGRSVLLFLSPEYVHLVHVLWLIRRPISVYGPHLQCGNHSLRRQHPGSGLSVHLFTFCHIAAHHAPITVIHIVIWADRFNLRTHNNHVCHFVPELGQT